MIGLIPVFACCLCLNPQPALAAPGSWTQKADLPLAILGPGACSVDGILYVVGGDRVSDAQAFEQLGTLFAYDPTTDTWSRKTDMPTARRMLTAAAVDGIIYVIGGGGWLNPVTGAVEAYDPKTDTWVTKTPMPVPRALLSACAVNGIIYTIGGADSSSDLATVEAYDPKTDQWTGQADLPIAAYFGAVNAVNGLIYACYGKETFAYDPQAHRWTNKAPIPTRSLNSYGSASSVADGIVYLFGGDSADHYTTYNFTLAYDPVQDKFTAKRLLPTNTVGAAAATIDGKVYIIGGANLDPGVYSKVALYDSLWVFDPQGGVTPQIVNVDIESTNQVRLVWQGEAGRLYGVESTPDPAKGPWTRRVLSTGATTVLATNASVEASCTIPPADPKRFFRALEANSDSSSTRNAPQPDGTSERLRDSQMRADRTGVL